MEEEIVKDEDLYEVGSDRYSYVRRDPRYTLARDPARLHDRFYEHFSYAYRLVDNIKDDLPAGYVGVDSEGYYLTTIPGHDPIYRLKFIGKKPPLPHSYIRILDYKRQPYMEKPRIKASWIYIVYDWEKEKPPIGKPRMTRKEFIDTLLEAVEPMERVEEFLNSIIYSLMGSPIIVVGKPFSGGTHLGLGGRYYSRVRKSIGIITRHLPRSFKHYTMHWTSYDRYKYIHFSPRYIERNVFATGIEFGADKDKVLPSLDTLSLLKHAPKPQETGIMKKEFDLVDFLIVNKLRNTYDMPFYLMKRATKYAAELAEYIRNKQGVGVVMIGPGKLVDYITYIATPLAITKVAEAIARYNNASQVEAYHIDKARDHIEEIFVSYIEYFGKILIHGSLDSFKYVITQLLSAQPMTIEEIAYILKIDDMYGRHILYEVLNKHLRGRVYRDRDGKYHVI